MCFSCYNYLLSLHGKFLTISGFKPPFCPSPIILQCLYLTLWTLSTFVNVYNEIVSCFIHILAPISYYLTLQFWKWCTSHSLLLLEWFQHHYNAFTRFLLYWYIFMHSLESILFFIVFFVIIFWWMLHLMHITFNHVMV